MYHYLTIDLHLTCHSLTVRTGQECPSTKFVLCFASCFTALPFKGGATHSSEAGHRDKSVDVLQMYASN